MSLLNFQIALSFFYKLNNEFFRSIEFWPVVQICYVLRNHLYAAFVICCLDFFWHLTFACKFNMRLRTLLTIQGKWIHGMFAHQKKYSKRHSISVPNSLISIYNGIVSGRANSSSSIQQLKQSLKMYLLVNLECRGIVAVASS